MRMNIGTGTGNMNSSVGSVVITYFRQGIYFLCMCKYELPNEQFLHLEQITYTILCKS